VKHLAHISGAVFIVTLFVFLSGCLVSGTFVTTFTFGNFGITVDQQLYHFKVDLSGNSTWEEHKDNIKDIEVVGFEVWITNFQSGSPTFNVYVDDADQPEYTTVSEVQANATKVIENLSLKPGPNVQTHVTYGQSFKYLKNVDKLKELAHAGAFHFYGMVDGATPDSDYKLDSARVIVTFTAGL
jgi:hypothetical protein